MTGSGTVAGLLGPHGSALPSPAAAASFPPASAARPASPRAASAPESADAVLSAPESCDAASAFAPAAASFDEGALESCPVADPLAASSPEPVVEASFDPDASGVDPDPASLPSSPAGEAQPAQIVSIARQSGTRPRTAPPSRRAHCVLDEKLRSIMDRDFTRGERDCFTRKGEWSGA